MNWSLEYADGVVGLMFLSAKIILAAIVLYALVYLIIWNADRSAEPKIFGRYASFSITLFVALAGVYVTYSIFRNQAQQNAEFTLNNHGTNFVNWERESPEIICLYRWHAFDDPQACRQLIFSSPNSYRNTMLYIEEVLFLLKTAQVDRRKWGSRYAEDITFWADDVAEDPTGMFRYNLVSENENPMKVAEESGLLEAAERLKLAMDESWLCDGFEIVVRDLTRHPTANLPEDMAFDPYAYCREKLNAVHAQD